MNKETSKEPGNEIFVAISSQKGGIGKSTITTLLSNTNPVDALGQAEVMTEDEDLDIVFFDLPYTINSNGVLKTLSQMDYIFVPVSAGSFVIDLPLQRAGEPETFKKGKIQ